MSSWFADKLAQESPPAPVPVQARTPGAWWQDGLQVAPQRAESVSEPVSAPPPTSYLPKTAESISGSQACPACGEYTYCEYLPDYGQGGVNMGTIKKCFNCRYPATAVPAPDAGGTAKSGRATRQAVAGSWNGEATFARAPRIL